MSSNYNIPDTDRSKKYQGVENIQLLLKGEYEYFSQKKVYSQENFLVYKNTKDSSIIFDSELLTRLDSGEFLKIQLTYHVNKNWIPLEVLTVKQVGKKISHEVFKMDLKKNILTYQFIANNEIKECPIQVPPKFQIATFNTLTSFLFISSKKYDSTGKNYYNIYVTNNILEFVAPPQINYIVLERQSTTPQNIKVNDKQVKAIIYKVFSQYGHEKKTEDPVIVAISRHFSIPYYVESDKNIRIQIKYLSESDSSDQPEYV